MKCGLLLSCALLVFSGIFCQENELDQEGGYEVATSDSDAPFGKGREEDNLEPLTSDGKFLLRTTRIDYQNYFGILKSDKKEVYPMVFTRYKKYSNGNFLFSSLTYNVILSPEMKLLNEWYGECQEICGGKFDLISTSDEQALALLNEEGVDVLPKIELKSTSSGSLRIYTYYGDQGNTSDYFLIRKGNEYDYGNLALVSANSLKALVPNEFKEIKVFGDGILCFKAVSDNDRSADYYDLNGKFIKKFKSVMVVMNNKLLVKNDKDKIGVLNSELKEIIPFEFDSYPSRFNYDGYLVLNKGVDQFVFDNTGTQVFKEGYQSITIIDNSNFLLKKNRKFGLLTILGKEMVPFEYDTMFVRNRALIGKKAGKWTLFDNLGESQVMTNIDEVDFSFYDFSLLKKDGKWAIWKSNRSVLDFKYEQLTRKGSNLIFKSNNKYGILNTRGEIVAAAVYDNIQSGPSSFLVVQVGQKKGVILYNQYEGPLKTIVPVNYDVITISYNRDGDGYEVTYLNWSEGVAHKKNVTSDY